MTDLASAAPTLRKARQRIVGADGVRALACLAVFVRHIYPHWNLPQHSLIRTAAFRLDVGVGVFFVLSGMLLSVPFLSAWREGKPMPGLRPYAIRRAARIMPAYYVCLTASYLLFQPVTWSSFTVLLSAFCFVNSFHFRSYFPVEVNFATWSIGVEMVFYFILAIWALGLFALRRPLRAWVYWLLTLLILLAVQAGIVQVFGDLTRFVQPNDASRQAEAAKWLPGKSPIGLFAHFMFGILAGWFFLVLADRLGNRKSEESDAHGTLFFDGLALFALAGITCTFFAKEIAILPGVWRLGQLLMNAQVHSMGYAWPLFPFFFALLLCSLSFSRHLGRTLDNRFLEFTSKISYGIYLWHMPVIYFASQWWPGVKYASVAERIGFTLAVLGTTYLIAWVSWTLLEQPILRWGNNLAANSGRRPASDEAAVKTAAGALPVPERETND